MIRPVFAEIAGSWPSLFSLAQMSAVRRSCQTMARCTACPVARSHTTVVSRWLVMPIAAMSLAFEPGLFQRLAADRDRRGPDVLGLVLDPARGREMLREFLLRGGGDGDVAAEHDGARGRGALIDGQHKGHDVASPGGFWLRQRQSDWEAKVNWGVRPRSSLPLPLAGEGWSRCAAGDGVRDQRGGAMICGETRPPASLRSAPSPATRERERITSPPSSRRRRPRWSGRS